MNTDMFQQNNGEISVWIEQGQSLCIKATTEYGDPVELSCDEAKELATRLLELAKVSKSAERQSKIERRVDLGPKDK